MLIPLAIDGFAMPMLRSTLRKLTLFPAVREACAAIRRCPPRPFLFLLALASGGCASVSNRDAQSLCGQVASFADTVPPGESRSIKLESAWGHGLDDHARLLYEKRCAFGAYPPGDLLCAWLMENTSIEFMSINVRRVLACMPDAQVSAEASEGRASTRRWPGAEDTAEITLSFFNGDFERDPWLELTAQRLTIEP